MNDDLRQAIAASLDADDRLLPYLPELLADLVELGTCEADVIAVLERCGALPVERGRGLDLACGKGPASMAIAQRFGIPMRGVDAMEPFVLEARRLAQQRGLYPLCEFVVGDACAEEARAERFSVVILSATGKTIYPTIQEAVSSLRRLVVPGGILVIGDCFLAEGTGTPPGYEYCLSREQTHKALQSAGDQLVAEHVPDRSQDRQVNERNTRVIRSRAQRLERRHPQCASLFNDYVAEQERQTRLLTESAIGALWAIRCHGGAE